MIKLKRLQRITQKSNKGSPPREIRVISLSAKLNLLSLMEKALKQLLMVVTNLPGNSKDPPKRVTSLKDRTRKQRASRKFTKRSSPPLSKSKKLRKPLEMPPKRPLIWKKTKRQYWRTRLR